MKPPNRMANWQSRLAQDQKLHERAVSLAKKRGQSLGMLIRTAIEEFLFLEEPRQAKADKTRSEKRRRGLRKIQEQSGD